MEAEIIQQFIKAPMQDILGQKFQFKKVVFQQEVGVGRIGLAVFNENTIYAST